MQGIIGFWRRFWARWGWPSKPEPWQELQAKVKANITSPTADLVFKDIRFGSTVHVRLPAAKFRNVLGEASNIKPQSRHNVSRETSKRRKAPKHRKRAK